MEYISILPEGASFTMTQTQLMTDIDLTQEHAYLRLPHPRTGQLNLSSRDRS
jgi:hypothetical protein